MNKQRKVLITTTYNEMGIIIDTKAEEVAQPGCEDAVYRKAVQMLLAYFVPEERYAEAVDGLRRLPSAQPGWIPCKTKFPEKDGSYLVTANNGQIAIFLFVKGMSENYWKQWGATAWCELPTPYREGGQE